MSEDQENKSASGRREEPTNCGGILLRERSKKRRCESVPQVTEIPGDPNKCSCGRMGGVGTEPWGEGEPNWRQLKND